MNKRSWNNIKNKKNVINDNNEMKTIQKIGLLIVLTFLLLPLQLNGQHDLKKLESLVEKAEVPDFLKMSDDGKWVSWLMKYENKPPIYILQNVKDQTQKFERKSVKTSFFMGSEKFAFLIGYQLELINLSDSSIESKDHVKTIDQMKPQSLFLIHYDEHQNNRLEVYGKNGKQLQSIDHVIRFLTVENELIAWTKNDSKARGIQVWKIERSNKELIANTSEEIINIWKAHTTEGGYLIFGKDKCKDKKNVIDNDKENDKSKEEYTLKYYSDNQHLPRNLDLMNSQDYHFVSVERSSDSDALFLTLFRKKKKARKMTEIWYGVEKDLTPHIKDVQIEERLLWYPKTRKVIQMDSLFHSEIAIGNFGDFLKIKKDQTLVDHYDNSYRPVKDSLFIWNSKTDIHRFVKVIGEKLYISPDRKWMLNADQDGWSLLNTCTQQMTKLSMNPKATPYFSDAEKVLWVNENQVWEQNLRNGQKTQKATFDGDDIEILNSERENFKNGLPREFISVDYHKPLILRISKGDQVKSFIEWKNGRATTIVPETTNKISNFIYNDDLSDFVWVQENFNKVPTVVFKQKEKKDHIVFTSNVHDKTAEEIRKIQLFYKGATEETLTATLFLPYDYDPDKKYPVVLNIYQRQQKGTSAFLLPTFKNGRGFNARLLLESGYMVLIPDITYGEQGPGLSAVECIHNVLDELIKIKQVDAGRIALTGQSFGGYQTNFIATHSNQFATFISGASVSDIIHTSYSFNHQYGGPDYRRYEYGQFGMGGSFVEKKQKYINNNPLYFASEVKSPMFLWTGEKDDNVDREETRSFFNVLRKYRKPVVAVFYQEEGHSLISKIEQKDLSIRMLEWLDYFLKDKRDVEWIDKQMKGAL